MAKTKAAGITMGMVLLVIVSQSTAVAGPDLKDGSWEITSNIEMEGMPMKLPPQTNTVCLTKKDIVPIQNSSTQTCTVTRQTVSGNTVSWDMACTSSGNTTTGSGSITYKGGTFEGTMLMSTAAHGDQPAVKMTNHMTGKWVGPCKQ